jgi:Domain of unknown function (DUF4157)
MRLAIGRAVPLPPELQRALGAVFGAAAAPLDQVRIIEHSLLARLHLGAIATTRRRRIYLRGSAADFFANPELMLHEYCHVLAQWESGRLTRYTYLREWLRRGYRLNAFEVEARRFAQLHGARLRALLGSG